MSTTKPLQGMPATKDAWKQHMQTKTGKASVDLDRADRLGLDQDTVDKLHAADTNKDGRLDWDEAWKAFDDFDSNGDSGSVDLAKLAEKDGALNFARGLHTLNAANDKVSGLRTTKTFDPTKTQTFTVGGRTVEFPPDALAKKPVVDKDWKDRPEISFQLSDGTDARLVKDPDKGWLAIVDHQEVPVNLGADGKIELEGVLKDDAKQNVVEGHALQIRAGGGTWTTVANTRAKSVPLSKGTVTIQRGGQHDPDFQVTDANRIEAAWIGSGKSTREYTVHFDDGRQVGLRWSGNNKYTVRAEGGEWSRLQVPEGRHRYDKLEILPDGKIRAEAQGVLSRGAIVDVFSPDGKLERTLDFTSDKTRDALKDEGAADLAKGKAAGLDLVNRAYKEQVDHGLVITRGDFSAGAKEQTLSPGYGKRTGEAIAKLASSGKLDEAKALQKKMVEDLYSADSPFKNADARRLAMNAYSKAIIGAGEPTASTLLPELESGVRAQKGDPSRLYLSKETYGSLDTLAQAQQSAGNLDVAKTLYQTAARAQVGGETKLLAGYRSGDTYKAKTAGGTEIGLNDPPGGHRVKVYDGMTVSPGSIAKVKAQQIEFSQQFQKDAAALSNLQLSADELNAVPPSPETMKKYFAAKYDGQMPAQMEAMRTELDAYMKVAYAHPQLNVPDSEKGWSAAGLPTMADGRIAADCLCMNRAVAHMLSGVGGLKIHAVENEGHARLAITTPDGKQGFVQSNANTAKLEGSGSLQDKVQHTVSKNEGLQVNWGMPAPIRLGAGFATGSAVTDVDTAFDGDFADASAKRTGISTTSTDGKSIEGGRKVKDLIQRYEAFRTKANTFAKKWSETPKGEITDAMREEKKELKAELEKLEKDLSTARGEVPSEQRRFLDAQKKNGGVFDLGTGRDWLLKDETLLLINGETGFSLSGSSW